MPTPRLVHWLMLGFLSLAWGFAFYLIAVGLESFGPLTVVQIRLVVGALTLYCIMRAQGHRLPPPGTWWVRFTLLAVSGNIIPFTLISWAETRISSAQAGLLMALMPISTVLLAHYFLRGEALTRQRFAGVMLGFLGVLVLIGGDALAGMGGATLLAQLAALMGVLAYAVNAVYAKHLPPINTLVLSTASLLVATVLLLPFTVYFEMPLAAPPASKAVLATVVLGSVSTGIATWMYFRVIADCGPAFLSVINYIIPAIAFAAGVLFLAEPTAPQQFLGLGLILAGIALTQHRQRHNYAKP